MKTNKIILAAAIVTAFGTASALTLKNEADKVGYAIGADMGASVKELGGDQVNINAVILGLKDAYDGADLAMNAEEIESTMQNFAESRMKELQAQYENELAANTEAGNKFLAENGKKTGVNTTASGLQYKIDKQGDGPKPTEADSVTVNYEGRLIDGKVFDSSYERNEPVTFGVTDVIPGWVEGLQLMNEGSKYTFYVPADLAYGEAGAGPAIPPNSVLIFDVDLLKVIPAEAAAAPAEKAEAAPAEKAEAAPAEKVEAAPAEKAEAAPTEKAEAAPTEKAEAAPAEKAEAAPTEKAEAAPAEKAEAAPAEKVEAAPAEKAEAAPAEKAE